LLIRPILVGSVGFVLAFQVGKGPMQKALLFFLAVVTVVAIAYSQQQTKEGFQTLMGVNWTSMNEGTPVACYTSLPVQQPKVVDIAEAGVGNIQPSPPPAADIPTAPFGQRSKEVPNPYKDPSQEPAKYIRLLGVKEDLQAFFGFEAPLLEQRSDPSIQIPLTRARADMGELIDVQSVMERNPGLASRINNKQLNDISANLRYLRAMLRDLENSGAIQQQALEGFSDMALPSEKPATLKELQEFQVKIVMEINKLGGTSTLDKAAQLRIVTLNRIKQDIDQVIAQLQSGTMSSSPILSADLQLGSVFLGKTSSRFPINSGPAQPLPTGPTLGSEKPANLKQLQEFQVKVVVEIQRLSASGTSDPVILARLNVLQKIKTDIDSVIEKLQTGQLTPETVPILAVDLERAFPILGNPTAPLPQLTKKLDLPPALSSLFPGGLSPQTVEQMKQVNNIASGYMRKFFDGASWAISLKYDNPDIERIRYRTAQENAKLFKMTQAAASAAVNPDGVEGLPGVAPSARPALQAQDAQGAVQGPAALTVYPTQRGFDAGLPGVSTSRQLADPPPARLDWKQRNKEIVQQIKQRGYNPLLFGAMPEDAVVSQEFSWRGHTQMMCMRLNTTTDPGLAASVGCPPKNWAGWTS
jgi:hypothetical protein